MRIALLMLLILALAAGPVTAQTFQPYKDPDKLFTIFYPKGWKVLRQDGLTVFTPDLSGPVSLSLFPSIEVAGRVSAVKFLQSHLADERAKYPDLKVVSWKEDAPKDPSAHSSAHAVWTRIVERKVLIRFWAVVGAQPVPSGNSTVMWFVLYQAGDREWRRYEPIFRRMLKSLVFPQLK